MISAEPARLKEINGIGETAVIALKTVQASAQRLTKGEVGDPPTMGSWDALIDYCRSVMVFETREQFRVLYLDRKNGLIAEEPQHPAAIARDVRARADERHCRRLKQCVESRAAGLGRRHRRRPGRA